MVLNPPRITSERFVQGCQCGVELSPKVAIAASPWLGQLNHILVVKIGERGPVAGVVRLQFSAATPYQLGLSAVSRLAFQEVGLAWFLTRDVVGRSLGQLRAGKPDLA